MKFKTAARWAVAVAMLATATIAIKAAQLFTPGGNTPGVIVTDRNGVTTYDPASTVFTVTNSTPFSIRQTDGTAYVFGPGILPLSLTANISNAGVLTGGSLNVTGSGAYPGVLLADDLFEFAYQRFNDPSNTATGFFDQFQFRGAATGGSLLSSFYQGRDMGITVQVLYDAGDTTYTSFAAAFLGHRTKINIEPIECTGVVGDYVWHDENSDGVQQPTPTEHGISGVNVVLTGTDTTGKVYNVATTTNGSGFYEFTKLCSGTYRVTADVPGGQTPTTAFAGGNTVTDSNGQALPGDATKAYADVTLTNTARQDRTIDFGFRTPPVCTGVMGNFVWHDLNRNGLQDVNEPGIANVRVNLLDQFGNPLSPARSTTTSANGYYTFEGLCGGTYTVDVDETTLPGGGFTWTPTTQFVGTAIADRAIDVDDSNGGDNGEGFVLNLPANNSLNLTIDFGYTTQCAAVIGDKVWYDANGNGLQDADEPGIGGVTVTAYLAGNDSAFGTADDVSAGSSVSNASGDYLITGLCAGTYKLVTSTVPPQYGSETLSFAPEGAEPSSNPTLDSNGSGYIVTLTSDLPGDPAASNLTIDFGYLAACTGTIGDFVWNDVNENGIQDMGEVGLAGAHVIVRRLSDNAVVSDTTTDATGFYQATGLCTGAYRVEVTAPAGYSASTPNQGGDATVDSNDAPFTRTLVLGDMTDATIDFGFHVSFVARPAVSLVKLTNGTDNNTAPGVNVLVGSTVTWSYLVTNTGNVTLTNLVVRDDNGTPANTADDFTVGTVASLAVGASTTLAATGTATAGQYENWATVTTTQGVSASDLDHYYGEGATIIIKKVTKPANIGSFSFSVSGTGYSAFTLPGGGTNTQVVKAGTYTVTEATTFGWSLTGIGGSLDANTPYACAVTGANGSTGAGDMNTRTATITIKDGDTVTCVFENTQNGITRTLGYWQTHSGMANAAWFGGSYAGKTFAGVTSVMGNRTICGKDLSTLGRVMGGYYAAIPKLSTGAGRLALDQARMQLLQQLLAAEMNASAFGSAPAGGLGMLQVWEDTMCTTDVTAILAAVGQADAFNNSGDAQSSGVSVSADSRAAKALADIPYWDTTKQ